MEDSLLFTLALCAFPALACLLMQHLFPASIMNDDAVIRTVVREIVLYRELPNGRRIPIRVLGWRYSIHVSRPATFKRRQRTRKQQRPARGNKRRPLLLRWLKRLRQCYRPRQDDQWMLPPSQDRSLPSSKPTRQPCPPAS